MNKSVRLILLSIAALQAVIAPAATVDLTTLAAQVSSNITARVAGAIGTRTNAVRALATPANYQLLMSTKLKDAAAKLALQKQLAEAAILDEEQTEAGRLKWHGAYITERIDLDARTATFVHADGTEYTVTFSMPNLTAEVAKRNAVLPLPPMTNGVPRALAEARLKRYQEKAAGLQVVSQVVEATGGNRPATPVK